MQTTRKGLCSQMYQRYHSLSDAALHCGTMKPTNCTTANALKLTCPEETLLNTSYAVQRRLSSVPHVTDTCTTELSSLCAGGWYCYDQQSCHSRWQRLRHLMTSRHWPETRSGTLCHITISVEPVQFRYSCLFI